MNKMIESVKKLLLGSHTITLVLGSGIAQIISIISIPILARLYSPDEFGVLALFTNAVSIMATVATLRYEFAIIIPKEDDDAFNVVLLSLITAIIICTASIIIIEAYGSNFYRSINNFNFASYLFFIPIAAFFSSAISVFNNWSNRHSQYRNISLGKIVLSSGAAISSIFFSYTLGATGNGLIYGNIFGLVMSFVVIILPRKSVRIFIKHDFHIRSLIDRAVFFRKYPIYSLPHALLDSIQGLVILFLMGKFYGVYSIGLYAMTIRVRTPLMLISSSLGMVFQQKAAKSVNNGGNIRDLVVSQWRTLVLWVVPFTAFLMFSPAVMSSILGGVWRESGVYIQILIPFYTMNFMVSSLSQLPIILDRQRGAFLFGIIYLLSNVGPWFLPFYYTELTFKDVLMIMSASCCIVLISYAAWIFYIAKVSCYSAR